MSWYPWPGSTTVASGSVSSFFFTDSKSRAGSLPRKSARARPPDEQRVAGQHEPRPLRVQRDRVGRVARHLEHLELELPDRDDVALLQPAMGPRALASRRPSRAAYPARASPPSRRGGRRACGCRRPRRASGRSRRAPSGRPPARPTLGSTSSAWRVAAQPIRWARQPESLKVLTTTSLHRAHLLRRCRLPILRSSRSPIIMPAADRSLDEVVSSLKRLRPEEFTHDRLDEILGGRPIRESSWLARARFRDDKYSRHLIHRTDLFGMILLCWKPGQGTPVHNHQGNLGWIRVLRGRIEETHWQLARVGGRRRPDAERRFRDRRGGHRPRHHAAARRAPRASRGAGRRARSTATGRSTRSPIRAATPTTSRRSRCTSTRGRTTPVSRSIPKRAPVGASRSGSIRCRKAARFARDPDRRSGQLRREATSATVTTPISSASAPTGTRKIPGPGSLSP